MRSAWRGEGGREGGREGGEGRDGDVSSGHVS